MIIHLVPINQQLWKKFFIFFILFVSSSCIYPFSDGGMYPVSLLNKSNIKKAGLKIPLSEIYNPDSVSLLNAIVRIGGCTGSFVSPDGLILTNHHCVFSALKRHSKEGKNYMEKGFAAESKEKELPMKGTQVKIMTGYKDISSEVLDPVDTNLSPLARGKAIQQQVNKLKKQYREKFPDLFIKISEMFPGKSYVLFKYRQLKDLRMVYVPARNVGEFGGSRDNWRWPRHSGDFAFVRAYVGKDGKSNSYNKDNVPFHPKRHLKVASKGVSKGDFVFIPGYPGRTYRHRSAQFLKFMRDFQLPFIADLFEYRIAQMKRLSKKEEKWEIKYTNKIKGLSNVAKNYRGKLEGFDRFHLYQNRRNKEKIILQKLEDQPKVQEKFSKVLHGLDTCYQNIFNKGNKMFWFFQLPNVATTMKMARQIVNFQNDLLEKEKQGVDIREFAPSQSLISSLKKSYRQIDFHTDSIFLKKMLLMAWKFKGGDQINNLSEYFDPEEYREEVREFVPESYENSEMLDTAELFQMLREKPHKILKLDDPFVSLWRTMENEYRLTDSIRKINFGTINTLREKYVKYKMQATGKLFIPDANATLRVTYGNIKGYWPKDAVFHEPFTTLKGYKEKAEPHEPYPGYEPLVTAIDNLDTRYFVEPSAGDVPICILYNTDTSGGNSGSPILNASGELIGLNFDRTYLATINDFAWNDSYSRSIGVDIRFILWYLKNVGEQPDLLDEMNVNIPAD